MSATVTRCSCAQQMYRNNQDGSRDYKYKGKSTCKRCQGCGRVQTCPDCNGVGLALGKPRPEACPKCCGAGVLGTMEQA